MECRADTSFEAALKDLDPACVESMVGGLSTATSKMLTFGLLPHFLTHTTKVSFTPLPSSITSPGDTGAEVMPHIMKNWALVFLRMVQDKHSSPCTPMYMKEWVNTLLVDGDSGVLGHNCTLFLGKGVPHILKQPIHFVQKEEEISLVIQMRNVPPQLFTQQVSATGVGEETCVMEVQIEYDRSTSDFVIKGFFLKESESNLMKLGVSCCSVVERCCFGYLGKYHGESEQRLVERVGTLKRHIADLKSAYAQEERVKRQLLDRELLGEKRQKVESMCDDKRLSAFEVRLVDEAASLAIPCCPGASENPTNTTTDSLQKRKKRGTTTTRRLQLGNKVAMMF